MELREYVAEALTRKRNGTLNAVKGLTQKQLDWRPSPQANSIGFLLWHIARGEDGLLNRWAFGSKEVWATGGWDKKIHLPSDKPMGEWTAADLGRFTPALADLLAYMSAVRESSLAALKKLDVGRLGEHPRPDRPEWSVATLLQIGVGHEAHHQGAIEYLVGLMKSQGV